MIREAELADAPGNPTLYATTRGFLEKFGLRSVSDLPDLDEFAPDDATRQLIRERLSAGGQEARVAPEAQMSDRGSRRSIDGLRFDFEDEGAGVALTSQQGSAGARRAAKLARRQVTPERVAADGQLAFSADDPASSAAQQMLADAMAQSFGLVEDRLRQPEIRNRR